MYITISQQAQDLLLKIARCDNFSAYKKDTKINSSCKEILSCQSAKLTVDRQLPVPWVGDIEKAPIIFISSNPALKENECVALDSWPDKDIIDIHVNAFEPNTNIHWTKDGNKIRKYPLDPEDYLNVPFWTYIWKTTGEILGIDAQKVIPGRSSVLSEIVHCKSNNQFGVNGAKKVCMDKYLEPMLYLSSASIIVLLGAHSTEIISERYGLNIILATKIHSTETHIAEREIAGRRRLIVALPHNNYHGKKGLTWLKPNEKITLLKWGKKAINEM
jgi:uracil-DNA glycosylase